MHIYKKVRHLDKIMHLQVKEYLKGYWIELIILNIWARIIRIVEKKVGGVTHLVKHVIIRSFNPKLLFSNKLEKSNKPEPSLSSKTTAFWSYRRSLMASPFFRSAPKTFFEFHYCIKLSIFIENETHLIDGLIWSTFLAICLLLNHFNGQWSIFFVENGWTSRFSTWCIRSKIIKCAESFPDWSRLVPWACRSDPSLPRSFKVIKIILQFPSLPWNLS